MKFLLWSLLGVTIASAADQKTFLGTITDNMCAKGDHSQMRMGSDDAECAIACVASHGASYVLYDGKQIYSLNDQEKPEKFAGKRVRIIGTLDSKGTTIRVQSIAAAN